jgi:hypothetical protein
LFQIAKGRRAWKKGRIVVEVKVCVLGDEMDIDQDGGERVLLYAINHCSNAFLQYLQDKARGFPKGNVRNSEPVWSALEKACHAFAKYCREVIAFGLGHANSPQLHFCDEPLISGVLGVWENLNSKFLQAREKSEMMLQREW